jgi:hypothetical protein
MKTFPLSAVSADSTCESIDKNLTVSYCDKSIKNEDVIVIPTCSIIEFQLENTLCEALHCDTNDHSYRMERGWATIFAAELNKNELLSRCCLID